MKYRINILAVVFSAPGIIIHEFSHELFCALSGVKVFKVKYLQLKNPAGFVEHAQPKNFIQAFFISVGPFIFGTLLSFGMFYFAIYLVKNFPLSTFNFITMILALWFGFSIAMNCFPSDGDARVLLSEANRHLFHRFNPFAILLYPFVFIIKIVNRLQKFYFDYICYIYFRISSIYCIISAKVNRRERTLK